MKREISCTVPWRSIYLHPTGEIKPCCISKVKIGTYHRGAPITELWENTRFKNFRETLVRGEMPPGCETCYHKEKQNVLSRRSTLDSEEYFPKEPLNPLAPSLNQVRHLDISLTNRCNMRCRHCNPENSTRWIRDAEKLDLTDKDFFEYTDSIPRVIDYSEDEVLALVEQSPSVIEIEFKGGEPLMARAHDALLRKLIEQGRSRDIRLSYCTNGSIWREDFDRLWREFDSVSLAVSVDGVGGCYEYVRGEHIPFELIEENLLKFSKISNVKVEIHHVLMLYNVLNVPDFVEWCLVNSSIVPKSRFGVLYNPYYLRPDLLPPSKLEEIKRLFIQSPHLKLRQVASTWKPRPESERMRDLSVFLKVTSTLDKIRGIYMDDYLPELAHLLRYERIS